MKRFGITVSLTLFLLFAFALAVMAQSGNTGTVLNDANLRTGPGTTYAIAGQAQAGQTITIATENPAGDWYQLVTGQWIAAFLVEVAPTTTAITTAVPTSATGTFVTQVANLRTGPSTITAIAGQVAKDQSCLHYRPQRRR